MLDDLGPAAPLGLWVRGEASLSTVLNRAVAVVGARAASSYGTKCASDLAWDLAARGITVVSGGAFGIDAAAHRAAIAREAPTVAFMAGGVDRFYPAANAELFDQILTIGAIVSETAPGMTPMRHRFLLRNRLIAALASSVVVAQARPRSGALNTARWASDLNRQLYAVPGSITSPRNAGCNSLIHTGMAMIISSMRCIDEICHTAHPPIDRTGDGITSQDADADGGIPSARPILDAIAACRRRHAPATADLILAELQAAGMSPGVEQVLAELARLELEGVIVRERTGYAVADG